MFPAAAAAVRHLAAAAAAGDQQGGQGAPSGGGTAPEGSAPSRPSLKDLLQASSQRIAQGDVGRLLESDGPLKPSALDSLAATAVALQPDQQPPSSSAATAAAAAAAPSAEPPGLDTIFDATPGGGPGTLGGAGDLDGGRLAPGQRLVHPQYGYAALGGVLPTAGGGGGSVAGLVSVLTSQSPRVNPKRRFLPGETYEPQDLNPFAARSEDNVRRRPQPVARPTAAEVMENVDYKNVAFLTRWFLTPAGRLAPRKQTRLPVTVHRRATRAIKLARHMGLIAGEARLDKLHLPRLREQELLELEARQQAAGLDAGSAGAGARAGAAAGSGKRYRNEMLDFGA